MSYLGLLYLLPGAINALRAKHRNNSWKLWTCFLASKNLITSLDLFHKVKNSIKICTHRLLQSILRLVKEKPQTSDASSGAVRKNYIKTCWLFLNVLKSGHRMSSKNRKLSHIVIWYHNTRLESRRIKKLSCYLILWIG